MKQKYSIEGMHCSSCSAFIEKSVGNLNGVHSCSVNLLQNSMIVDYDSKTLNDQDIIDAVVKGGYTASPIMKDSKVVRADESIKIKKRLLISAIILIPLMYLAMGSMLSLPAIIHDHALNAVVQAILTTVIMVVNKNYFTSGFKTLFKGHPNMDSLIAMGATSAFVYSVFVTYELLTGMMMNAHNLYYESAAMILTLITLGKYMESKAKKRTGDAVSKLMDLTSKTAIVLRDDIEIEIEVQDVLVGDILIIKPGQSIPVDGVIVEGSSSIDESSISGESVPVEKESGDSVISGTLNKMGSFTFKASRVGDETTIAQIIKLVDDANSSKPQIARKADKVSGVFVPIVIAIATIVFLIWLATGQSFNFALTCAISVLVISCPCALGLATPTAIMVGSGQAAKHGILVKSAESLEISNQVDTIVLDKTGTITTGRLALSHIDTTMKEEEFLQIAYSLEQYSEHPLSMAINKYAKDKGVHAQSISNFQAIGGKGVEATIDGKKYIAGNIKFMEEYAISLADYKQKADEYAQLAETPIFVADNEKVIGLISMKDEVKDSSFEAIEKFKKMGLKVYMLTGDNKINAEVLQKKLQLDDVYAEVLPQDKEQIISKLQAEGKTVMMVGDGVNDAPALTKANVGVAIGAGSDIAIDSADIVLIKSDLRDVLYHIALSHKVIRNIHQNLFWAFFYNVLMIPLAAGLFYNAFDILLNPMFASAAMSMSSICVVLNALRLRNFKA